MTLLFELSPTESTANYIQLLTLTKFNLASLFANTGERFSPRDQLIQEIEEGPASILSSGSVPHTSMEY